MEKKNASAEDDHKLMELGKKFKLWMKEWEGSAADKKAVMQKITKAMSAEKLKKINKAQEAKKEKKRLQELEKKKLQIVVGSKVKLLKGRQTGLVEEIQGNKAKVMFGNLKTIASLESLEAVE
jgi:transcription antitermination factor NusG